MAVGEKIGNSGRDIAPNRRRDDGKQTRLVCATTAHRWRQSLKVSTALAVVLAFTAQPAPAQRFTAQGDVSPSPLPNGEQC